MFLRVLAVALLFVSPVVAGAAYMKIGSIKGESLDARSVEGEDIDVLAWSWGVSRQRGDTVLGDVVVVRELDKSSTKMQESVQDGGSVGDVTFLAPVGQAWVVVRLEEAVVTNYQVEASGTEAPREEVSFSYSKITWTYSDGTSAADGTVAEESVSFSRS